MASRIQSRDMAVALQVGNIAVSWSAEAVSWSPDVADDMARRCTQLLHDALAEAAAFGILLPILVEDDDAEEVTEGGS